MRPDKTAFRSAQALFAVVLAAVMFFALAAPALAALEDDPKAVSATNPGAMDDKDVWWRDGWGSSLFPHIHFQAIPSDVVTIGTESKNIPTTGFLYRVDRSYGSVIQTTVPDPMTAPDVHWSSIAEGPTFDERIDLQGVFDMPPPGGWATFAGATTPIEGTWWLHIVFANYLHYSANELVYFFGYDATDPLPPTSLDDGLSGWTEAQRRRVVWNGASDALSGLGAYEVTVKNAKRGSRTTLVTQPKPIPPGYTLGEPLESTTIEDLGPGKNTITVQAVDRAGNESAAIAHDAYVDTDTPKASISSPKGSGVGKTATFVASVTDLAGISSVKFYIDGVLRGTDTASPYSLTYNTASLGGGTHTLQIAATDMCGHMATASKKFTVDFTAPSVSSVSGAPNPFFPRLRDNYRDDLIVRFRVSEACTARLRVTTAKGAVVRELAAYGPSGSRSFKWNGRDAKGHVVGQGTYSYRLTLTDSAGNAVTSGASSATVRYYILVRVSGSQAKVVEH